MSRHPYAAYWDRGETNVPDMTGAKYLLEANDQRAVFTALGFTLPLQGWVIDIGCGTGRLSQLCANLQQYIGFDIAPSAIEYCKRRGIDAHLITGPRVSVSRCDLLTCVSVCTHISRDERREYLTAFAEYAREIVVDIVPGDGSGGVELWTAVPEDFEADIAAAGYTIQAKCDHQWDWDMHRYYRAVRA